MKINKQTNFNSLPTNVSYDISKSIQQTNYRITAEVTMEKIKEIEFKRKRTINKLLNEYYVTK